ncbi:MULTISPECIES: helix-turn-helix transcriptional regulator [Brucella]|uniref:helix-turn-helix transcriptional regulator n=1 Tax=Brucella TaxID=234 RepID=UPI0004669AB1|nr:LuxR C-terminal-related transcriptional regulator [Brucella rhizosphaerae]
MGNNIAYIVSDSSLLCSSLENSLRLNFKSVICKLSVDSVEIDDNWSETVLIVDAVNPEALIQSLKKLSLKGDLSRTIILMRGSQSLSNFREVIGFVGGLLPNSSTVEEVGMAASIVRCGLLVAPSELVVMKTEADDTSSEISGSGSVLTEQENRVLACICEGSGNKIIARKLEISDSTVRVHVRSILRKLGFQNRTQAALYAVGHFRKHLSQPVLNALAVLGLYEANTGIIANSLIAL